MPSMPKGETVGDVVIDGKGYGKGESIEAERENRWQDVERVEQQQKKQGSKRRGCRDRVQSTVAQ